jgi:hypothetical protein
MATPGQVQRGKLNDEDMLFLLSEVKKTSERDFFSIMLAVQTSLSMPKILKLTKNDVETDPKIRGMVPSNLLKKLEEYAVGLERALFETTTGKTVAASHITNLLKRTSKMIGLEKVATLRTLLGSQIDLSVLDDLLTDDLT